MTMDTRQELPVPARVFLPTADIFESKDALTVILEMPGVEKSNVDVRVEDGVLSVQGRLDLSKYQGLQPLYTAENLSEGALDFRLGGLLENIPGHAWGQIAEDVTRTCGTRQHSQDNMGTIDAKRSKADRSI
jgi:hypothetical protein